MSSSARRTEFSKKLKAIRGYLKEQRVPAVALSTHALFAWATAGGDNFVTLAGDNGVAYLVVTARDATVVTNSIEYPRFCAEEFGGLEKLVSFAPPVPWFADGALERAVQETAGGRFESDTGVAGSARLGEDFLRLTYALTAEELARYRELGRDCALAMEDALANVRPGCTETAVAAQVCRAMYDRNVRPHLALVASDERVHRFRHPIPKTKKVRKHLMAVLCGKRGGLIVNLTRLVYFGSKLPAELRVKHDAVCAVDAAFNGATVPGAALSEVFETGVAMYEAAGFGGEWQFHHQGGPTGYQGRSYLGRPSEIRPVLKGQAFAWNPSIAGTKSEDTAVAGPEGAEFISQPSKDWPLVDVRIDGRVWKRPDIKLV